MSDDSGNVWFDVFLTIGSTFAGVFAAQWLSQNQADEKRLKDEFHELWFVKCIDNNRNDWIKTQTLLNKKRVIRIAKEIANERWPDNEFERQNFVKDIKAFIESISPAR